MVPDFSFDDSGTLGLLWAVLSAALFAVLALMNRRLLQEQSFPVVAFYQQAIAAVYLLPFSSWDTNQFGTVALLLLLVSFVRHYRTACLSRRCYPESATGEYRHGTGTCLRYLAGSIVAERDLWFNCCTGSPAGIFSRRGGDYFT